MPYMRDTVTINGPALRAARRKLGYSQQKVADAARLSRSYLSELELGKKTPGSAVAQRLADVFDLPIHKLIIE